MLNGKQKDLANDFISKYADLDISWVDFSDGRLEVYFKDSISNPWTVSEFMLGSNTRKLLEGLENRLNYAKIR